LPSRSRPPPRAPATASVALALALTVGACLPDLRVFPAETVGGRCGDGYVDGPTSAAPEEACDPGDVGAIGCSPTCTLVCEGGVRLATKHCYFLAGAATSYAGASQLCRAAGAHVVTFAGADEIASVDAIVSAGDYWVGLVKDPTTEAYAPERRDEPGYPAPPKTGPCLGCFARADPTQSFPPEPGASGELGCLIARRGASTPWQAAPCARSKAADVVCEREPPGTRAEGCPGGVCVRLSPTTKRYLFVPSPAVEPDAAAGCASFGGRLVLLESPEEREELAREIARLSPDLAGVWIGLARAAGATAFLWDDETAPPSLREPMWADKEPLATGPSRAYLDLTRGGYDTRLVRAHDETSKARPYVCQY
jgi:hypothetical protein